MFRNRRKLNQLSLYVVLVEQRLIVLLIDFIILELHVASRTVISLLAASLVDDLLILLVVHLLSIFIINKTGVTRS